MQIFHFRSFFFPSLWRTLSWKLMKRPAVFITYFQITVQNVHVYRILRSGYFFQKFVGRFNLMSTFFAFQHFCEKTYSKTCRFYDWFSNLLSLCAPSQNLGVWNFFSRKWWPFLNINNFLFISTTLSNICEKTYEKTYRFFLTFANFNFSFTCLQNFLVRKLKRKKWRVFQYVNKTSFIPPTLNNILDKNCEKFSKFWNLFFNFVSFVTLSRNLVVTTFLQRNLQLFECYNKRQNVIKKSLLCGRFSQKWNSFKRWSKWIQKYGLRFVKSANIRFVTHRFSKIQYISNLQFFFWKFAFA